MKNWILFLLAVVMICLGTSCESKSRQRQRSTEWLRTENKAAQVASSNALLHPVWVVSSITSSEVDMKSLYVCRNVVPGNNGLRFEDEFNLFNVGDTIRLTR